MIIYICNILNMETQVMLLYLFKTGINYTNLLKEIALHMLIS